MTKNGDWTGGSERFNPSQLDAREWVRVLKETGFKEGFWWSSTTMAVLCRQLTQIIQLESVLGEERKGDLLLEVSQAATEFDMDARVYLYRRMPVPSIIMDRGSGLQCLLSGSVESYQILTMGMLLSSLRFWMDGAREGRAKVNYEFEKWF